MRFLALFLICSSFCFAAKQCPPAPPIPEKEPLSFLITGNFIYWQATQDFMDFAVNLHTINPNDQVPGGLFSAENAKTISMKTDFDPGFKLGVQLPVYHDEWEAAADYTFYQSTNQLSVNHSSFLVPKWVSFVTISELVANSLSAKWHLKTSVLNFGLQRPWNPSPSFKVRPFLGLATAWIDQKVKEQMPLILPSGSTGDYHVSVKSNSWAIGPRASIAADWYCTHALCLTGKIGSDLLMTFYHLKTNQYTSNNSTIFYQASDHEIFGRPELDGYFGLRWEKIAGDGSYRCIEAGYDIQVWWHQNMLRGFVGGGIAAPQGNLYLQGLTVTLKFGF